MGVSGVLPLGGKHVLIYSTGAKVHWQSGELDCKAMRFHPERTGIIDHGTYYTAKSQIDARGSRILWGWIPETRPEEQFRSAAWSGVMSLPRVLSLDADGQLLMQVAPAFSMLRGRVQFLRYSVGKATAPLRLSDAYGKIVCVSNELREPFKLSLRDEASQKFALDVGFDPACGNLTIGDQSGALTLAGNQLSLHIYVDRSAIEILVEDHLAYTARFYFSGNKAPDLRVDIAVYAKDEASVSIAQLHSVWR